MEFYSNECKQCCFLLQRVQDMIGYYDAAIAIQKDRRHLADIHRVASNLPKERSLSLGRYRLTLTRQSGSGLPAA